MTSFSQISHTNMEFNALESEPEQASSDELTDLSSCPSSSPRSTISSDSAYATASSYFSMTDDGETTDDGDGSAPINADRIQSRRQKNRESAARSRQKVKQLLIEYKKKVEDMKEEREALINERILILKEIDNLQNILLNCKLKSMEDFMNLDPLNMVPDPTPPTDPTARWNAFLDDLPDPDPELLNLPITAYVP